MRSGGLKIEFIVDEELLTLKEGNIYEINNCVTHSVFKGGDADRIHFIIDYIPPQK